MEKAQADYDANGENGALTTVCTTSRWPTAGWKDTRENARDVLGLEADRFSDVKAAKTKMETARSTLGRMRGAPVDEEAKAEDEWRKADDEYRRLRKAAIVKIENALGVAHVPDKPDYSKRHLALLREKSDAEYEAEKRAKAEKTKAGQAAQPVEKSSCPQAGGLAGALNNVACQEQHAGAGH